MRLLKILLVLVILLLIVLGVFAWTLPADLAYRYAANYLGPVTLSGVRGSVWNGHADGVSAFGRDLGELDWRLEKAPLLHRQLVADLRIKGADVDAAGAVTRNPDDTLVVRDLRFRFPAGLLEPALDVPALKLLGTISGVLTQATLANGFIRGAIGNARWSEAGVSGQAEARFSDILADFASRSDGSIAGTVHDDGQGNLKVDGSFSVRVDGYDAQARLVARNGDPQVMEMLRYIGQPQPDGSSKLVIHGRLFKLF
ncbi:MAG TPA: type II secretion system protein N [Rhodanobacteraceae bacterium]|nr:type II secretion system protein N [Rhodanobacteraceae bacterium]